MMNARTTLASVLLASLVAPGCAQEPKSPSSGGDYPLPGEATRPAPGSGASIGTSPSESRPAPVNPLSRGWPDVVVDGDNSVAIYAPKALTWDGERLRARVPVEVDRPSEGKTYGIVEIDARTTTDSARQRVKLSEVAFSRAHFPSEPADETAWLSFLQDRGVLEGRELPIAEVRADLAKAARPPIDVKSDPPRVVFTQTPKVLVPVDGSPVLREDHGITRVLNTHALIASEPDAYYVWAGDRWFRSHSLVGDYAAVPEGAVRAPLNTAKDQLERAGTIDPLDEAKNKTASGATAVVATDPTELIETKGALVYAPIAGTTLDYVSNTEADVFRDKSANTLYLLLAGRWYRAPGESGPWKYVAPGGLPATFASIPADHPKADVRASVQGTPEAEEALIASEIPTTAEVDRSQVHASVAFDGPPQFEPVAGADANLRYATNTATPVLQADGAYYALDNGVWFSGASPSGPWVVAERVPETVYSIPVSSPLYYTTYVRVYDATPDTVFVGYTPGYYGAFGIGGVVVWGTGYRYRPWVGRYWYGPPVTWGFGVGFRFGVGVGFAYGGWGRPWWGPGRWGGFVHTWGPQRFQARYNVTAYNRWGGSVRSAGYLPGRAVVAARGRAEGRPGFERGEPARRGDLDRGRRDDRRPGNLDPRRNDNGRPGDRRPGNADRDRNGDGRPGNADRDRNDVRRPGNPDPRRDDNGRPGDRRPGNVDRSRDDNGRRGDVDRRPGNADPGRNGDGRPGGADPGRNGDGRPGGAGTERRSEAQGRGGAMPKGAGPRRRH